MFVRKYANLLRRGLIRAMTYPVIFAPEGAFKIWVRSVILSVQNSLPVELTINSGDTVVQVGTPWPSTVRRMMKAAGPRGRIVVIEAEQANVQRLRNEFKADTLPKLDIVHIGAWSCKKTLRFALSPFDEDHKLLPDETSTQTVMDNDLRPGNENYEIQEIPVDSLDNILGNLGIEVMNCLWVTVNGAELEVLEGAREVLDRSKNVRIFAKGHARLEDGNPLNTLTKKFMSELGYHTKITRGEPSVAPGADWRRREGDLFAWR